MVAAELSKHFGPVVFSPDLCRSQELTCANFILSWSTALAPRPKDAEFLGNPTWTPHLLKAHPKGIETRLLGSAGNGG